MTPPVKPFDTYSWRWLTNTPSESLLQAPVFLGVLRALGRHENEAYSAQSVADELLRVQRETGTAVDLARSRERNLIRNSGQYWRGTGLLDEKPGIIRLTKLGRQVADGDITQGEFAALMVQETVLPNPRTYTPREMAKWQAAGLTIRPLQLILQVVNGLGAAGGLPEAYLTPSELTKVVVPLAGAKEPLGTIVESVAEYRLRGEAYVAGWPDCTPEANDRRIAREFLLFLSSFEILRRDDSVAGSERYHLDFLFNLDAVSVVPKASIFNGEAEADTALEQMQHSDLPSIVERQRATANVLVRTGQARFRSTVLGAYSSKCIVTGELLPQVLEAAHIVPVTKGGADTEDNSFCLRVDIHRLYDGHHIRIAASGLITLSDRVKDSSNYRALPASIAVPAFVKQANLTWRNTYL